MSLSYLEFKVLGIIIIEFNNVDVKMPDKRANGQENVVLVNINKDDPLEKIKESIKAGQHHEAFRILCSIADPADDFVLQVKYAAFCKNIISSLKELKPIRVALVTTSTATHFSDVLKFWLAKEGLLAEMYEAECSMFHQVILDPQSALYAFKPEVVMLFTNYRDFILNVPLGSQSEVMDGTVISAVDDYMNLARMLKERLNCRVIMNNADLPYHRVLGNYEATAPWGSINILRQFNLGLARAEEAGITVLDMDFLSSVYGKRRWHEARFWYHSKHAFSLDATGLVAQQAAKSIGAFKGLAKKCIVLDLDNTLWGGTIGDDGLEGIHLGHGPAGEAYVDFQKFILHLKDRGILLAVCSKNEDDAAREPFVKHPDMLIKLEDILVFKANWNNKADNIRDIAEELNIGLDSIVFIDDNPVERALVRELLPMVSVPELSSDPSNYVSNICHESYFETVSFSQEDRARTDYYRKNIERSDFRKGFTDLSEYLQSLQMEMTVGSLDDFNIPRIEQLINKSNQFHLTTTRYSESELRSIMERTKEFGFSFRLKDRFGDNGLISAVITKGEDDGVLLIDTWVMSCRVLSRGVEEFVCREVVLFARKQGYKKIRGKYIPTKKNKIVAELYKKLGFSFVSEEQGTTFWEMDLHEDDPVHKSFIKKGGV